MGSIKSKIMKLIEHTHPRAGYFSHIEIDKKSLSGMGIDTRTNVFVVSPSVVAGMEQNTEMAERISEAWHSHFKHLILAMPGLVEAAYKVVTAFTEMAEQIEISKNLDTAMNELNDALTPYKDII